LAGAICFRWERVFGQSGTWQPKATGKFFWLTRHNVLIRAPLQKLKRQSLGWSEGVVEGTCFPQKDCPMENLSGCESLGNPEQAVLEGALAD
jgi:hypothetical protein